MLVRVIVGRFQPFHNGHLEYALEAAPGCDLLMIGLTRSLLDQEVMLDNVPRHRLEADNNPFTVAERSVIALSALREDPRIGVEVAATIVPIEQPEWLAYCIPRSWEVVLTLHEEWNLRKKEVFELHGYRVRTVCTDTPKSHSGRSIRQMLRNGDPTWREHLPAGAVKAMDALGVVAK